MIQSGYSQNLQRNIKKAKQQGLYVKEINDEKDILRLGVIFDNLYQWRKVKSQWIDSPGTFLKWSLSPEIADKTIWFGIYNAANDLIGGMMLVKQGDSLFYQLGATDPEFRNLPILHLCFHEAILYAKEHNFLFFDFGGYDTDAKENDQTNNINLFKKQFGGEVVSNFPDIVVTLNPFINTVNNILMRLRHKLH